MARTVNELGYAEKRTEILMTAQRLMLTRGFENMTIADILAELKISSGAFYHYFPSRPAVLEALVEHMMQPAEQSLVELVHDPHINALEKLQWFFGWVDAMRSTYQANVLALMPIWYGDENAVVRQKIDDATRLRRAPLLTEIVRQGIQEGCYTTRYPEQAGDIVFSLAHGMGNSHARLLLSVMPRPVDGVLQPVSEDFVKKVVADIVAVHAAYMDAIERVLGAPTKSLYRADEKTASGWVSAVQDIHHA